MMLFTDYLDDIWELQDHDAVDWPNVLPVEEATQMMCDAQKEFVNIMQKEKSMCSAGSNSGLALPAKNNKPDRLASPLVRQLEETSSWCQAGSFWE